MATNRPRPKPEPGFWDTSAILPLCCRQPQSAAARQSARIYGLQIVWWGTAVECYSAFCRLTREGSLTAKEGQVAFKALDLLRNRWNEMLPSDEIRQISERLLRIHPLRAADALQLAAALVWCDQYPNGRPFLCADHRLSEAAEKEGFRVIRF